MTTEFLSEVVRSTTMMLSQLRIDDPAFRNPRTFSGLAPSDIIELALEILHKGLLTPLLVTEDGLVIGGGRRFRALTFLPGWRNNLDFVRRIDMGGGSGLLNGPMVAAVNERVDEIVGSVPVFVIAAAVGNKEGLERLEGIALADNIHRIELSGFEIAARLTELHGKGATGVQLARLIGKSPSYVSRKLSIWRHAGPELRDAWMNGMSEDSVEAVSKLTPDEQARALIAPIPRGRRGPAHRPSVDDVRDFLFELESREIAPGQQLAIGREAKSFAYRAGVIDALRWATGQAAGADFVDFVKLAECEVKPT